jgi:hypothetical protein
MWRAQPTTFTIFFAPIVDLQRWAGFDVLAVFNDTFWRLCSCYQASSSCQA